MSDENETKITSLVLPDAENAARELVMVRKFQEMVRTSMVDGLDWGIIEGTGNKPALFKAGAEKIIKLMGLADTYTIMENVQDWQTGFFHYLIKCTLTTQAGNVVTEGLGECNSMESKYRWRMSKRKCPACGLETIIKGKEQYGGGWVCFKKVGGCGAQFSDGDQAIEGQTAGRVPNDDIYSQVNTLLKMAEKRAMVDAALHAGRLSDLFTQDVEDMAGHGSAIIDVTPEPAKPAKEKAKPSADKAMDPAVKAVVDQVQQAAKDGGYTTADIKDLMLVKLGKDSSRQLTVDDANILLQLVLDGYRVINGELVASVPDEGQGSLLQGDEPEHPASK